MATGRPSGRNAERGFFKSGSCGQSTRGRGPAWFGRAVAALALACAAIAPVGVSAASASAATVSTTITTTITTQMIPGIGLFDLTYPSLGTCVAVGGNSSGQAMMVTITNGVPGTPLPSARPS